MADDEFMNVNCYSDYETEYKQCGRVKQTRYKVLISEL